MSSSIRYSNFELLRIIAITMIIGLHYLSPDIGGGLSNIFFPHYNFFVSRFFESLFIVGVNCFILIMGYFQIDKSSFKFKKVTNLLVLTLFYSVFFYLIAVLFKIVPFNLSGTAKAVLPFLFDQYWFVKIYLILYLLSPFINVGLNGLDEKSYRILFLIMILLFSVWPSFLPYAANTDKGYGIITFVMLYSIGAYIKKYYQAEYTAKFYLSGYFIFCLIIFAFSLNPSFIGAANVWSYNFIFTMMASVCLFLFFSKLQFQSKIINYLAGFVFGVYLIHTNPFIGQFIYLKILRADRYWFSPLFFLHLIFSVIIIYVYSTAIDIVRLKLFKRFKIC